MPHLVVANHKQALLLQIEMRWNARGLIGVSFSTHIESGAEVIDKSIKPSGKTSLFNVIHITCFFGMMTRIL